MVAVVDLEAVEVLLLAWYHVVALEGYEIPFIVFFKCFFEKAHKNYYISYSVLVLDTAPQ